MTDSLDIEDATALRAYLEAGGHVAPGAPLEAARLSGGVSNRTVRVRMADGTAWVMKQALAQLRVAVEWHCSPERIFTEAEGLRWFAAAAPGSVPELVFEDQANHILAMRAVPEPHATLKALLLEMGPRAEWIQPFGALLGALHAFGERHATEGARRFADRRYFIDLRLEPYYRYTAVQAPALAPFLAELEAACLAHRHTVVHGDYSPKNVLVHAGRLLLIDHEVAHFGEGAFDVGFALAHLLSKAHHSRPRREAFLRAAVAFWEAYAATHPCSADAEARVVAHALGCLAARAAGRSPLEYLDAAQRARQVRVVTALARLPPVTVQALAMQFGEQLQVEES